MVEEGSAMRKFTLFDVLAAAAIVFFVSTSGAAAATMYVANNGIDVPASGTCGSSSKPCRTISKAISVAAVGATISVGPGRYGNLDGSAASGDWTGEEIPSGCLDPCIIAVNKRVKIYSRDGAAVTVITGRGVTAGSVVEIK
jgi:hypothetical protein